MDSLSDTDPRIGWIKSFEQEGGSGIHSIIGASDGGAVATGYTQSSPNITSLLIIKTDSNGKKMWDWTEAGNPYEGYSIIETPDKGFAVVGSSNTTLKNGILLVKLDPNGKKAWMRVFRNGDDCRVHSISATREGGFIIAGSLYRKDISSLTPWDGFIIKTDADGMEQWTHPITGEKNDSANFVQQTEDGGYIITGTTENYQSTGDVKAYLLKMNGFGVEEWFTTYGSGLENDKMSVIQTEDGGYIFSGIGNSKNEGTDLFLVRTDDMGKEQWEKTLSGSGRINGYFLIQTVDGVSIISGSSPLTEPEKTTNISILDIDLDGRETRNLSFGLGQPIKVQDIGSAPHEGFFVAGTMAVTDIQKHEITIIKILDTYQENGTSVKNQFDLTIVARDATNGKIMGGAHVYLDGSDVGSTSEQEGKQILPGIGRGLHSVRVVKSGYQETTRYVDISEKKQVSVFLNRSVIIPLQIHGSTDEKIDIVFVASKTAYDCDAKTKIPTDEYTNDEQKFKSDVNDKINNVFFKMDTLTSGFVGLPGDFRQRFNFYYYWDEGNFADAFDGCAGNLPDAFWDNAPFTDVAVILYPSYNGSYSGNCEPIGCANGLGAGSGSWMKAPADSQTIFIHESGHVVFGLIDTYCGDTYYVENSPFPNVWRTEESCKKNADQEHWYASQCRQIFKPASNRSPETCSKNFWRLDSDPDIMGSGGYSGRFGNASTTRIRYILDTINRWEK